MSQFVLLILPETEGDPSRAVGPFMAEHLAHSWGNVRGIAPGRRLVWPLEEPKRSVYGQGRHALIPSPGPRGGIAGVLHDAVGPPEPAKRIQVKPIAAELANLPPVGRPVTNWITEEGMALEPDRVISQATNTGHWKGTVARFGIPTVDGRGLEIGEDWLPHFVRMPVPLTVQTVDGPRVVGVVERAHVENDRLEAEGRISLDELAAVAPERLEANLLKEEPLYEWPAGVYVTNGHVDQGINGARVHGPWELMSVLINPTPIWPDCSIRVERVEQSTKLLP